MMNLKTLTAPLGTWKFWKELIIMTVGMFIAAAAVYYFLVPSKIVVGSISGLSIVISALFENAGIAVKVSTVVLVINAILLVLAYFLIGKEFGLKTCYTALILGPMMDVWEKICPSSALLAPGSTSVMGELWFDLLCFVLILSMSQAIMFRINASTGGLDILAKIVIPLRHWPVRDHRGRGHLLHRLFREPVPPGDHRPHRHLDQRPDRGLLHGEPEPAQTRLHHLR